MRVIFGARSWQAWRERGNGSGILFGGESGVNEAVAEIWIIGCGRILLEFVERVLASSVS